MSEGATRGASGCGLRVGLAECVLNITLSAQTCGERSGLLRLHVDGLALAAWPSKASEVKTRETPSISITRICMHMSIHLNLQDSSLATNSAE